MLEAADSEREIIQRQLDRARERIQELEKRIADSRESRDEGGGARAEIIDLEYQEEDEEEEEPAGDRDDELDEMYERLDDSRVRRRELDRERIDRESEAGDEPYWLVCPKCGDSLEEVETEDVKIERCETCGGIYLDRGEIDMLLSLGKGPRGLQRIRNVLHI